MTSTHNNTYATNGSFDSHIQRSLFEPTSYVGVVVTRDPKTGEVKVADVFAYPIRQCAEDTLNDSVVDAKAAGLEVLDAPLWDVDDDGHAITEYNAKAIT